MIKLFVSYDFDICDTKYSFIVLRYSTEMMTTNSRKNKKK